MWKWITASRTNKIVAASAVIFLVLALVFAVGVWHFRSQMQAAKQAERVQQERGDRLEAEGKAKDAAYQKAIGATEIPLKNALQGVREAKASLAQVEASRRGPWMAPAVDNGDLVARFEKALERIQ